MTHIYTDFLLGIFMINRILEDLLIKKQRKSLLLLGARQVGKSTLIRRCEHEAFINLADEATYLEHLKDPSLIRRIVEGIEDNNKKMKNTFIVDEIQRIPSILNTLQALIDERPQRRRFLLTGSSARKLKRGQANLLPGRILYENLFPLCYWEIEKKFGDIQLAKSLTIGLLPEIFLEPDGSEILDSYVELYLREEIQAEALTKDLGAYSRFLDIAALLSGQYINYSQVSSDTEIAKETIRRYFSILEETLLIYRLPSYTQVETNRKVRQRDKFLFFDMGVRNALLKRQYNKLLPEELGHLFEQWIILQIMAYNKYYKKHWKLSTYRDDSGLEVDLVIEGPSTDLAIEIKYGEKYRPQWGKGLKKFKAISKKTTTSIIVYRGHRPQKGEHGEKVLPYKHFLSEFIPSQTPS